MGNKDYLSGGCDLPGKLLYEKLDKNKQQKMIMPKNLNINLEQKIFTECVTNENYYSAFPAHPSPLYPGPENPSPLSLSSGSSEPFC